MNQRPWTAKYVSGTPHEIAEIPFRNLSEMVRISAEKYASQTAFSLCLPNGMSGALTFSETERLSDAFAVYLREKAGCRLGDRVALQMPNCLAYPIAAFGILKAGCVIVNVNPLYTAAEMHFQFADSGARVLVIIDLFADKLTEALQGTPVETTVLVRITDFFPVFRSTLIRFVQKHVKKQIPAISVAHTRMTEALKLGRVGLGAGALPLSRYLSNVDGETVAILQYTGGTTGVSKGAMLTHRNLMANLTQVLAFVEHVLEPGKECVLTALPLYHVFAFTVNLLLFHFLGAKNVMVPSPRPLISLKPAFEGDPISIFTGVNTLFNGLCGEDWFAKNPPRSLKASIAGGMALQKAVADKWVSTALSPIIEGYGLTESSPVLTLSPLGGDVRTGTIGIPMPSTDIICVDDDGQPVPLGTPGELWAKGPQIMKGYWNRPDETEKTLKEGWLRTGDIATMDEDGYFKIVDRKKDMILVGGFNVYPNEVEDCLMRHPGVQEAAVIGVLEGDTGEAVQAFIVKKNDSLTVDEIKAHCRKTLTGYKVPRYVEFRTELPKSPVGKILRKELRKKTV